MTARPLRVLVLGKDPSLFRVTDAAGDARRRHIYYTERLRQRYPGSEIRILTYTTRRSGDRWDAPCDGLQLFGTGSWHRTTYVLGLLRRLPAVLAGGWRPDVISVQEPWEEGVVGAVLARRLRARFVPQLHVDLFSPDWASEHWLNPWRRRLAVWTLRRAQRVRVVSHGLRERLADAGGVDRAGIEVAPVGVDFLPATGDKAALKSRISALLAHRRLVLFVGRLCAAKNLGLWAEVAAKVAAAVPDAAFAVVGDGEDGARLRREVAARDMTARFVFLGRRSYPELPAIYAAADVFLLTSHYEGFGRVVLEAMLAGIPVVSTACTGPEDLIDHGRSGFLLARGDAAGLAGAVGELLRDPAKAAAFGDCGRAIAAARFSLKALTDRVIDVWARV